MKVSFQNPSVTATADAVSLYSSSSFAAVSRAVVLGAAGAAGVDAAAVACAGAAVAVDVTCTVSVIVWVTTAGADAIVDAGVAGGAEPAIAA
jgi:hypothetical protein